MNENQSIYVDAQDVWDNHPSVRIQYYCFADYLINLYFNIRTLHFDAPRGIRVFYIKTKLWTNYG